MRPAQTRLTCEDIVATALARSPSIDLIQRTRGGDWPTGPVSEDEDFLDLVWHELDFRAGIESVREYPIDLTRTRRRR